MKQPKRGVKGNYETSKIVIVILIVAIVLSVISLMVNFVLEKGDTRSDYKTAEESSSANIGLIIQDTGASANGE